MHTHRYKLLAFAVDFLKSLVPIKLINLAAVPDGPDIISVCVKCDNSLIVIIVAIVKKQENDSLQNLMQFSILYQWN